MWSTLEHSLPPWDSNCASGQFCLLLYRNNEIGFLASFPGLPGSSFDRLQYTRFHFCILQAIKNRSRGRPGNEAIGFLCHRVTNQGPWFCYLQFQVGCIKVTNVYFLLIQGCVLWAVALYPRTISTISIIRLSCSNYPSSGDFLQVKNQTTLTVSRLSLWSLHSSQLLYKSAKVRLFESRSGAGWNKMCCWKSMCLLVLLNLISLQAHVHVQ